MNVERVSSCFWHEQRVGILEAEFTKQRDILLAPTSP